MKRTAMLAFWLSLIFMLPVFPGLCDDGKTSEEEQYAFPIPAVVVNPKPEERLNLRAEPDTAGATKGKFYTGVEVDVFSLEDGWAKVSIGGGVIEGYMLDDYLKLDARAKSVTAATPKITVTHAGGKKLYNKRVTGASLVGRLQPGDRATVLAVTPDDWLLVYANKQYAFMKNGGVSPAVSFAVPGTASADYESGNYAGVMKDTPLYKDESKSEVIRLLARGELVTVLRFGAQMSLVSIGRDKGYVSSFDVNFGCGEWNIPIYEYTAVVNCPPQERLNLRTKPDTNAYSLGKYYNGVRVVVNSNRSDEWILVAVGNLEGYMKSEFLAMSGTAKADSVVSGMPILCVTTPAGKLNLRTTASTSSPSLGAYSDGTLVALCGLTDEWAHVIVDGKIGFMLRKYLSDPAY